MSSAGRFIVLAAIIGATLWFGLVFAGEATRDTGQNRFTDLVLAIVSLGTLGITAVAYAIGRFRRR